MDPRDEKWKNYLARTDESSREGSIVSVEVSPTKLGQLGAPYRYALLAKVLFKKIRADRLYYHLLRLWSLEGTMKMQEHANDFFVIVLSDPVDYVKVVGRGPWMIAGHYITLQPFVFNFNPWEATIARTPIWVRLPEYPVELYDMEVFQSIAKALGGYLVKIDRVTEKQVKVKFARLCIEVDLSRPLALCFEICGRLQRIEYEGLYMMCSLCRRAGHLMKCCPSYAAQPDFASQGSGQDGPCWLQGVKLKERQVAVRNMGIAIKEVQGSDPTDDNSGSSSDLIKEVSTRYLEPDEGTSSFVMNDEMPMAEEDNSQSHSFLKEGKAWHLEHGEGNHSFLMNVAKPVAQKDSLESPDFRKEVQTDGEPPMALKNLNKSDAWGKPKTRHSSWKQTQLVQSCARTSSFVVDGNLPGREEVKPPTSAWGQDTKESTFLFQGKALKPNPVSDMPYGVAASKPSISVPTTPLVKSLTMSLPTFFSQAFEAEVASQSYSEEVKKSTKHKEINAKSIQLIKLDEEPVILSTKPEVSSIQAGFSISPASSYKAWIKVTPNEPGLNSHPRPIATMSPKKLLCCTCEGEDDTKFAVSIDGLIKTHNPSVVFLSHINSSGSNTCRVIHDSKFSGSHIINPLGSFGGLLLLWREDEVKVVIQPGNSIHINATMEFTEQALV